MQDESEISVLSNKPEHKVNVEKWLVGMLRKPNSDNPHHVLLVVEGRNSFGQAILRRYDLYIDEDKNKDEKTGCPYAKIDIKPDRFCAPADAKAHLTELIHADEYYVKAWPITVDKGKELHSNIQASQKDPPLYLVSGDLSSIKDSKSSTGVKGHSCYTWARAELKKIGVTVPKSPLDVMIAIPDFVIKAERNNAEAGTGCRLI